MNTKQEDIIIELNEIFYQIKKHFLLFILVICITTSIAGVITYFVKTPQYTSETLIYFKGEGDSITETLQGNQLISQTLGDYSIIFTSETLANQVIQSENLDLSIDEVLSSIKIEKIKDTHIIKITTIYHDPYIAQKIAIGYGINAKKLANEYDQKEIIIIDQAKLDLKPAQPNHLKDLIIGGGVGVAISLILLYIFIILNDKIHSERDVEYYLGIPVIATIPYHKNFHVKEKSK